IITGGNAGIGLSTAEAIARQGGKVVLACRSLARGKSAAQAIAQKIGQSDKVHKIEVRELDLASLESVRSFARAFNKEQRRLDVLICNAGIMAPPERQQTADGLELQFQVNYLGHWLLAHELLNDLGTRLIFLSSTTHRAGKLDFGNLQLEHGYSGFKGYANSKLATLLAAKEFQRHFNRQVASSRKDVAVAVHPGLVDTKLAR
ncbi:NAD(P)-binding protein, partial [Coccomyxa subellipsoidea C-169]